MATAGFYRPNMLVVETKLDLYFVPHTTNLTSAALLLS